MRLRALALIGSLGIGGCSLLEPPPPEQLSEVPAFAMVGHDGQPFGDAQLRGRVWVANFIFTRCTTVCPVFTADMRDLHDRTRAAGLDDVRLVSFSVDPGYDTPEVLIEYARAMDADRPGWTFVTGDPEAMKTHVMGGMKTAIGEAGPNPAELFHGSHFVLVDSEMYIRDFYESGDAERLADLLRDAGNL